MTAARDEALAFRRLMGRWPTGVAIVTARSEGRDYGLTVNALLSVSLSPPTLLVSLGNEADSTPVVERSGRYAVSFLTASQRAISERFAQTTSPEEKFRDLPVDRTPGGLAVLPGSVARLECRVRRVVPELDHRLVFGEVDWVDLGPDAGPLLFHRGGYAEDDGHGGLRLPPARP